MNYILASVQLLLKQACMYALSLPILCVLYTCSEGPAQVFLIILVWMLAAFAHLTTEESIVV